MNQTAPIAENGTARPEPLGPRIRPEPTSAYARRACRAIPLSGQFTRDEGPSGHGPFGEGGYVKRPGSGPAAPRYWLTCTTFAGGKPLNQVADALL